MKVKILEINETCEVKRHYPDGDIQLDRKRGYKRFEPESKFALKEAKIGSIIRGYLKGAKGYVDVAIRIVEL